MPTNSLALVDSGEPPSTGSPLLSAPSTDEAGGDSPSTGHGQGSDDPVDRIVATPSMSTPALSEAEVLVENLVRCVVEILAGARELEQVSRWVTEDVYRQLHKRVVIAARAREAHGIRARRPLFRLGDVRLHEPTVGAVEAVVVVHGPGRSRGVAVRLARYDGRWRATAVHVL